ncbi:glycerol-3-phosphate dehydrogenase C-terminal domain-containing protein [Paracoccus aerius]
MLDRLGQARRFDTKLAPIGGGRDYPADPEAWAESAARGIGTSPARAARLLARYGTTAQAILTVEGAAPEMLADADYSIPELDWLVRHESVQHLADLVMRRTPWPSPATCRGATWTGSGRCAPPRCHGTPSAGRARSRTPKHCWSRGTGCGCHRAAGPETGASLVAA